MERRVPFQEIDSELVTCGICPHRCRLRRSQQGICRVRINRDGTLVTTNYGHVTSCAVDPVEKKPLYHFWPGSTVLSVGSSGCNFRCGFCQNYEISQNVSEGVELAPEKLVELALSDRVGSNCIGIAFTYSEPLMWFEYVIDAVQAARQRGLKTVLVTNGYINDKPRDQLLPLVDALNIDVKAMNPQFYRRYCSGNLDVVLNTVQSACAAGVHVELTNLLIPGLNDRADEIKDLVQWVAGIDQGIPLHFTRYSPSYKFTIEPTPQSTLAMALEIGRAYLHYVYVGNVSGLETDTVCPDCRQSIGLRRGFSVRWPLIQKTGVDSFACAACGRPCDIVGRVNL